MKTVSVDEKQRLVAEQESSGEEIWRFCERRGIPKQKFYSWRQQWGAKAGKPEGRFINHKTHDPVVVELSLTNSLMRSSPPRTPAWIYRRESLSCRAHVRA